MPIVDNETAREVVIRTILAADFRRATFGGAVRGDAPSPWVKISIRPVQIRGDTHLQFSYFDEKKDITKNFSEPEVATNLKSILNVGFARIHLSTSTEEIDIHTTKKGKTLIGRKPVARSQTDLAHNRTKDVPLPEGRADRLLEVLGILTKGGQVRPTMRGKFTQINEFLKLLLHAVDEAGLRSLGRPVRILDCGCGLSYLTLAVHHYFNDVIGIPARILGVDVNDEVIRKSIDRSRKLGAAQLEFACGPIGALNTQPDIVVALHACDTATDEAIAQAVLNEAKVLLSVPCCHHELNDRLRPTGAAAVLRPLLRHGILHQRTADIVTDAFRALALRIMGYRTDVVEFISAEHTTRNVMIRAVRGVPAGDAAFVAEYKQMRRFWEVTPYIETALGEAFHTYVG
jgi:SAM-dependent methyltransferase